MGKITSRILLAAIVTWLVPGAPPALSESWMNAAPLTDEQLAAESGREGVSMQWQVNNAEQNGSVTNNVLTGDVVTGDNYLSDQAFGQMNGVATVIQNTGNQTVIQDSTQINIILNQ